MLDILATDFELECLDRLEELRNLPTAYLRLVYRPGRLSFEHTCESNFYLFQKRSAYRRRRAISGMEAVELDSLREAGISFTTKASESFFFAVVDKKETGTQRERGNFDGRSKKRKLPDFSMEEDESKELQPPSKKRQISSLIKVED